MNTNFFSALQTAIGPVILISGVGLLLLTMTNRLGRTIDRARALTSIGHGAEQQVGNQLTILLRRARILRAAILLASLSALLAAIMVILLFFALVLKMEWINLIAGIFIASMMSLIGSLIMFMRDVNQSLGALLARLPKAN